MQDVMRNQFYKQRSDFELSAIERDKTQVMPEGVSVQTDIPYMNDGDKAHRMDVYRPEWSEDTTLPVVINIHGGGLLIGSKEFNRFFCAKLSRLGYLVFSIEYRLVPDCMVFDQFSDVCNAFKYINAHLVEYNGDSCTSTVSQTAAVLTFSHILPPWQRTVSLRKPHMSSRRSFPSAQSDL